MPDQLELDPLAILHALGRPDAARAIPISGGADTAIWRIEQGSKQFALRVFRPGQTAVARREVAAMDIARSGGLPVPSVHAEGRWRDRPALLLTWMPGQPLAHELRDRPWLAWPLGVALGHAHAVIHAVSIPPGHLDQTVSWVDWANPDDALRCFLLERAGEQAVLLHLDMHPLNVLVEGRRLTAVLDWANARLGDPRADLARTASILRFARLGSGAPAPVSRIARRTLEAGWRHAYRAAAGPVRGMAPFYAWAGAAMVKDLSPRLGRPDMPWLTPAFLNEVRVWEGLWRRRAGLGDRAN